MIATLTNDAALTPVRKSGSPWNHSSDFLWRLGPSLSVRFRNVTGAGGQSETKPNFVVPRSPPEYWRLLSAHRARYFTLQLFSTPQIRYGVSGLILNPYLLLVFVFFEGLFRLLAALASAQILPYAAQIIAWIHSAQDNKAAEVNLVTLLLISRKS